jgi:hypothetical protein
MLETQKTKKDLWDFFIYFSSVALLMTDADTF